jgi:hypothetical protein
MPSTLSSRLTFHGSIALLAGLFCGLPTVIETANGSMRFWHTAHEALILVGLWLWAASAILPQLLLDQSKTQAFFWAHLGLCYGFSVALILGATGGFLAFEPSSEPLRLMAFVGAVTGILGAATGASLAMLGARAAARRAN